MNERILITGPPGAGKTYLASAFSAWGINAVDADSLIGLHGWFDAASTEVEFPANADREFLVNHRFLWNRSWLQHYLTQHPDVLVLGLADNVFNMMDLFDRVYFLKVAPDVLVERLMQDSRINPMGKTVEQQLEVLEYAHWAERHAVGRGAVLLDGSPGPAEIIKKIARP